MYYHRTRLSIRLSYVNLFYLLVYLCLFNIFTRLLREIINVSIDATKCYIHAYNVIAKFAFAGRRPSGSTMVTLTVCLNCAFNYK